MKVLKFGGSSVATPSAISKVKQIIENSNAEKLIIVVSAFGGVTDALIDIARKASKKDDNYEHLLSQLQMRHITTATESVIHNRSLIIDRVAHELENLSNILKGVYLIGDLPTKTLDAILSYGERLSSLILSGVIVDGEHFDSMSLIKSTPYHNKHVVNLEVTEKLVKKDLANFSGTAVLGGFISTDAETNDITNLGRGGSDYTASIIAATLEARVLEIWSDVDGFMTADPRVISHARTIPELSFIEAMELCNFGAKVIYPPTIYPAYHKNIPIIIKNTFNPESEGTKIYAEAKSGGDTIIKGISSINHTTLITVSGLGMVGVIGVNYRIFRALAKKGISVFFVSQAASENNTSIGVSDNDGSIAIKALTEEFVNEIERGEINPIGVRKDVATVAIVGEGMRGYSGVIGKLFGTVGRNGINIISSAQGGGETNISFIVKRDNLQKTVGVIHDSFFLSECVVLNLFVAGVGLVGSNLLEQIAKQQSKLKKELSLDIRVVGIANSKGYIYAEDGIELESYLERLKNELVQSNTVDYGKTIIECNLFNSVFVDCTASQEVANIYYNLLSSNISVVAANKCAASSPYYNYNSLKEVAQAQGVKYLFEANVGAGLPVISTIKDLIKSGDKILKIQAVVSGTLNFLFNTMSSDVSFSQAVKMAMTAGYAEPDPRLDLNGMDVIRKIVILAREAGYKVEIEDVKSFLFLENELFEGSLEKFWDLLPGVDEKFEEKRKQMATNELRWRFVATMERGDVSVQLCEVDSASPFYDLEGSNNVILLTTERYNDYPLQIKGYGAGASVTAAGVFADIIKIVNI